MKPPRLISLEGNLNDFAGNILDKLQSSLKDMNDINIEYIPENIELWMDCDINYSFPFQMKSIINRTLEIERASSLHPDVIIMERSPYSNKHIFTHLLHKHQYIDDLEYDIYNLYYENYCLDIKLDAIVYIEILLKNNNTEPRESLIEIDQVYRNSIQKYSSQILEISSKDLIEENWIRKIKHLIRYLLMLKNSIDI